jgi:hypothetical protein
MTSGKLYSDMEDSGSFWWIEDHLDEAKADFPSGRDYHSMDDHYDAIFAWMIKWFGEFK